MKKGLKKFTVPYSGLYSDGDKISGQRIVFAENAEIASEKVRTTFQNSTDTEQIYEDPIICVGEAKKWVYGDETTHDCYWDWW